MWVERAQNKQCMQCDGTTQQSLPVAGKDCCVVPSHCLIHCFLASDHWATSLHMQLPSNKILIRS